MRQQVLDYIKTLNLSGFKVSNELPFDAGGSPLYLKNPKTIYVNFAQTTAEPFITTLNGLNISNETTTVSVFFSTDAKLVPSNYDALVQQLKGAKNITTVGGVNRREVDVSTDYEGDLVVSEIDLRYIKLI
jgi:hypothetical protein